MALTVRLDREITSALARRCAERGVSKSSVVRDLLAAYLWGKPSTQDTAVDARDSLSPAFLAFQQAGLIGTGTLDRTSANKSAVRRTVLADRNRDRRDDSLR
jgi:Ribbon-helix-helix protein, copG family